MIQLVAECWAALAAHWGCLWGTERVWGLPSRWMNGPSGRSSISGSHRPEILLADSQQSSKQWCLCADPGPLGGQNSFDSSSQRVGAQRQHMISVLLTLALVAICTFCFWCSIGKTTLVLKRNGFMYVFIYFKLHQLFQNTSFLCDFLSTQSQLTISFAHVNGLFVAFKWRKFLIVCYGQAGHFLWPHISALMCFQCSVFWAKAANPFDSESLQKEANAVFAVLLLLFIYFYQNTWYAEGFFSNSLEVAWCFQDDINFPSWYN